MIRAMLTVVALWFAVGVQAQRPVVIEEFTGTWCGPCYGSGIALDRVIMNYPQDSVMVLAYHVADSFSTPSGDTRDSYYAIGSIPTAVFNGVVYDVGGSSLSAGETGISTVYNRYVARIQQEQARTSSYVPFSLRLTGSMGPQDPSMTLSVSAISGYPRPVSACFAITENAIAYSASNGQTTLNSCVRVFLSKQTVNLPEPGQVTVSSSHTGTIPCVNAANLHPFVFLQDETTDEILGAIWQFSYAAANDWALFQ